MSKFAWLAQYISQMFGMKTEVYRDVIKSMNDTFKTGDNNVDKWKSSAKKKGLKTGGES